ncbi:MAG: hypothetical protein ACHP8A_10635 [Terriglobales bacterium]|jgi:hypothetical protein|nr:hypothetical protein [Terriglobales bacterium]
MIRFAAIKLILLICISSLSFAGCIPFTQARQHIGETSCIKGKVFHVNALQPGYATLSFCKDQEKCGFTALVSANDPKSIAGLHGLRGRTIEMHGLLKESNGGAEIILQNSGDLLSRDTEMPSFMKAYDVEERGHYSAGTSHAPKAKRVYTKKQTATGSIDIPRDTEPSDNQ